MLLATTTVVVALLLRSPTEPYRVTLRFEDAGQLVTGNRVLIGGAKAGAVERIDVTDDGRADVGIRLDDGRGPLRRGTRALIRVPSLAGVAGRAIELHLAPDGASELPRGAVIPSSATASPVELDLLLATFDPPTRRALQGTARGLADATRERGKQLGAAFGYLDPALTAVARLSGEAAADPAQLRAFVRATADLSSGLATRPQELTRLVDGVASTSEALAAERLALTASLRRLPRVLRRASSTNVELRAALRDLEPFVSAGRPAARRLGPFVRRLRPLTRDARPTLAALARALDADATDDVADLLRAVPASAKAATGDVEVGGRTRPGAFPATTEALAGSTPILRFARPYAPDLTGWFDDFSHTGTYDALGGLARVGLYFNAFSVGGRTLAPINPADRAEDFARTAQLDQRNRCPGSAERDPGDGSTPYRPTPDFPCDPRQVPLGP